MIADLEPYPAYKPSGVPWLGEVPGHWDFATVRRYCRVFAGATPSRAIPEYWRGGSIPWLASGDVNLRRISGARQFITEAGYAASSTKWIRPGSLVLALAGQGRTKGMVATVEYRMTCNQSLAAVEPFPSKSDFRFLAYYLESRYLDLRALVGDGLRDGLNLEHVRAIPTPLPPLPEQAAIVRFLDHADRRIRRYIRAKQKLIKLLEEQKQAIIHRAVTRGLDPNVRLKPSGVAWLGDVPKHWEVVRLKFVAARIVDCLHATPKYSENGEFPAIRTADISPGMVLLSSARRIESDEYARWVERLEPKPGDILYSREGERFGIAACVPDGARLCVSQRMMVFRIRPEYNPVFVMWLLNSKQVFAQACQDVIGATAPHINVSTIRNYSLALPPRDEQDLLVAEIESSTRGFSGVIANAVREISLLREYRTRLIADVVTGKLDVRETATRLPDEAEEPVPLDEMDAPAEGDENGEGADLDAVPEEVEA